MAAQKIVVSMMSTALRCSSHLLYRSSSSHLLSANFLMQIPLNRKELEDMKKRLKEIEEEAGALREMQAKVKKEMGVVQDPSGSSATHAEKEEVDARLIYVGNFHLYGCSSSAHFSHRRRQFRHQDDFRGGFENGPWWHRIFNGYTVTTWLVVLNLGSTGLLVSWLMKHADNIVKLFLGVIICMMFLNMYFAPPNMLLDKPLTVKQDEERLIEVFVDRRTHS